MQIDRNEIASQLLRYEKELIASRDHPGIVVQFTPEDAANALVLNDPNSFLFAVIFDQGIPAERAWAAPYHLRERLGHIDIGRIAAMSKEELSKVVAQPPALRRYIKNVPDWLIEASRRMIRQYGSNAANIWNDNPTASRLIQRFVKFKGVGQKKAAMATQIVARDMLVPIREMFGTQVAYDAHPGALDLGAWYVGRTWCRPLNPECDDCRLTLCCGKRIELGRETGY